jgi:hypothetical protein
LRKGDIEAADGKAIAALSQQICNTVSLEIEVAKLRLQYPSDAKMIDISAWGEPRFTTFTAVLPEPMTAPANSKERDNG